MLKGHVQIELHNHKTGLRDRIEQDNLVTDALDMVANICGTANVAPNSFITPIATNGLGGVFLFDNTLTESASNVLFPDNAKLIASANQTLNSSDPHKGSINSLESGRIPGGYLNVWDFSTGQANGIIKSLSLTNVLGANDPAFPLTQLNMPTNLYNYNKLLYVDFSTNSGYWVESVDGTAKIVRRDLFTNNLSVYMSAGAAIDTAEYDVIADSPVGVADINVVLYEDELYYIFAVNNSHFGLAKIDISDWTSEVVFDSIELTASAYITFTVANGYLYYASTNGGARDSRIYKKNLSTGDTSIVNIITTDDLYNFFSLATVGNGLVYGSYRKSQSDASPIRILLYPDDSYILLPNYSDRRSMWAIHLGDDLQALAISGNANGSRNEKNFPINYLGTICNLQTPVEKTASMSMKVKYSLTNV